MKNLIALAGRWLREDAASWLLDTAGVGCIAAIVHGVAMIYVPAAWILAGAGGLAFVFLMELRRHK